MKKILYLTAICAAAFVGCTNDNEDPQQVEVNFSPISYKSTRAIISGTVYKTTDPAFGVYAYYIAATTNNWNTNGAAAPLYINDATISYNSDAKVWKSATPAYWPLNGSLTLIAYSPKTVNATCATANKVLTVTDFDVANTTTYTPGSQADLLYTFASTATGLTTNSTAYAGVTGGAQGAPIVFRHALSQVLVKVKLADSYSNTVFKVNSIKLLGMNTKGTFKVTPTFGASYSEGTGWSLLSEPESQVIYPGDSIVVTTTKATIGDSILVIPQSLVSGTQKLEIKYQMTKTDILPNVTTSKIDTVVLNSGTFTAFAINKKVTLNVSLSADEIQYAPSVIDWDPQDGPLY